MSEPLIYSRAQWGAHDPKPGMGDLHYPVPKFFVHHEAGPVWTSVDIDAEKAKMRNLQTQMMNGGYSDIAYGVCIFPSGRAYEGRDLGFVGGGHDLQEAATIGENAASIAACAIGNYELQDPTSHLLHTFAEVIRLAQFCSRVRTDAQILGHRQAAQASTACPGARLYAQMATIRGYVAQPPPEPPEPTPKVRPRHDPPMILPPLKDDCACPSPAGAWAVADDGAVFTFGDAPYLGGANGKPWNAGRHAARIEARRYRKGLSYRWGYRITFTNGQAHNFPEGT